MLKAVSDAVLEGGEPVARFHPGPHDPASDFCTGAPTVTLRGRLLRASTSRPVFEPSSRLHELSAEEAAQRELAAAQAERTAFEAWERAYGEYEVARAQHIKALRRER